MKNLKNEPPDSQHELPSAPNVCTYGLYHSYTQSAASPSTPPSAASPASTMPNGHRSSARSACRGSDCRAAWQPSSGAGTARPGSELCRTDSQCVLASCKLLRIGFLEKII